MLPRLLSFIFEGRASRFIPLGICGLSVNRSQDYEQMLDEAVEILASEPPFVSSDRAVIRRRIKALYESYMPRDEISQSCCLGLNPFIASSCSGILVPFLLLQDMARLFISEFDGMPAFKFWQLNPQEDLAGRPEMWWSQINHESKLELWRSLSLRIDTTPVLAAFFAESRVPLNQKAIRDEVDIRLNDQIVLKMLSKGLAETHLHLSAGFSFRLLVRQLLDIHNGHLDQLIRNLYGQKEYQMLAYLAGFLITRCLLLDEIFVRKSTNGEALKTKQGPFIEEICKCIGLPSHVPLSCTFLNHLRQWVDGDYPVDNRIEAIRKCTEWISHYLWFLRQKKNLNGSFFSSLLNDTAFLTKTLRLLENMPLSLQILLLFYLQMKNRLFRFVVQEHGAYGFTRFRERFVSMRRFGMDKTSCLTHLRSDDLLRKVEVRISIDKDDFYIAKRKIIEILREQGRILGSALGASEQRHEHLDVSTPQEHPLQIGIIIHFVKPDNRKDPYPNDCLFSYLKRQVMPYLHSAWNIYALLERVPALAEYLVGIDVANTETSLPNFCFYPPISILREAWRLGGRKSPARQSMSLTYHAGEYFYDPLAALFSIDELLNTMIIRPGDRLGHGLITGMNLGWWCDSYGPFVVNRDEDILGQLWLWKMTNDGHVEPHDFTRRKSRLFLEVAKWLVPLDDTQLSHNHKELINIWSALSLRHEAFHFLLMHDPEIRSVLGLSLAETELSRIKNRVGPETFCMFHGLLSFLPKADIFPNPSPYDPCPFHLKEQRDVLTSYFFSKASFLRGRKRVHRNYSKDDVRVLQRLQEYIRRKLDERGIVLEANLTSNWVILGMRGIEEHPIFTWYNQEESRQSPNLVVSLNTDNPAVFNTRLEMEYAMLFNAALRRGYSRQQAMELLEQVRKNTMLSCFVRRERVDLARQLDALKKIIDELDRLPRPLQCELNSHISDLERAL